MSVPSSEFIRIVFFFFLSDDVSFYLMKSDTKKRDGLTHINHLRYKIRNASAANNKCQPNGRKKNQVLLSSKAHTQRERKKQANQPFG